jgi:hypothetical protein
MGSGFRSFAFGEVLTSANVQNYLMDQAVTVFAGTAARGSAITSPETGMVSYRTDGTADSKREGFEFYDGSAWTRMIPAATTSGVVQVKSTTKDDTFTMSSGTFADVTGLSVSITPTSASNRILVFVMLSLTGNNGVNAARARLMRDSTAIGVGAAAGSRVQSSMGNFEESGTALIGNGVIVFSDAPASTSALTYKVQISQNQGADAIWVNRSKTDSDNSAFTRTISTITVMEIAP